MSSVHRLLRENAQFFDDIQKEAGIWADGVFGVPTIEMILEHLKDELIELSEHNDDPSELADCMLLLMHYCRRKGAKISRAAYETREQFRSLEPRINILLTFMDVLKNPDHPRAVDMAGLIFVDLVQMCEAAGVNPKRCLKEKLDINRSREWSEPDSRGVINHQKKSALEIHVKSTPPWTDSQVQSINCFQHSGLMHPFTWGHDDDGQEIILVATREGLVLPGETEVVQTWVHEWMSNWHWRAIQQLNVELMLKLTQQDSSESLAE